MSEKVRDSISDFHDYGIYLPTRTIELFGEITEDSAKQVIKNIHILDNSGTGTITINLMSEGGDVGAGLAIYDAIRYCKNHVRGIAIGEVASIATVIIQACDERVMFANSYFMLHEGSASVEGKFRDKQEWDKFFNSQEERTNEIYLQKIKQKKPKYSMPKLTEFMDRDRILLPKQVIEMGLADRIQEVESL
jgi:ATP-dependent Clp protease protease subunit